MYKTLLITGLIALSSSIYYLNTVNEVAQTDFASQFAMYKTRFNKRYGSAEDAYRLAIYTANMIEAKIHNAKPESTYTMGETQFTDLTQEEFVNLYLSPMTDSDSDEFPMYEFKDSNLKAGEIDWRAHPGVATHVKNQGQCGSCWAFSAVGGAEAFFATEKGLYNLDLAEQQLVDCDTQSVGCNGGYKDLALSWIAKNGITTQDKYPYVAKDQACALKTGQYKVGGAARISATNDGLIQVLQLRPVTVSVDATNWSKYTGGVFNNCAAGGTNHAVLAFGYDGVSWLVKNSWGTAWGEKGFIRLSLGNTCAVLSKIFIAV